MSRKIYVTCRNLTQNHSNVVCDPDEEKGKELF
jgi:hypothetical protein